MPRGATLIVAERAHAPIIGFRYGLSWYFARYASSMRSLIDPSTASKVTSFELPATVIRPAFCSAAALYHREFFPLYARTWSAPSITTDQIQVGVP